MARNVNPVPSATIDDYLKTIYHHTEWQDDAITPSQLAVVLGLAPSSVTEMVKKLAAANLVTHRPYGPVSLSEAGRLRATAIIRRHRLIETWLVESFGYGWDEVHEEAEVLEHALSEKLLNKIDAMLGFPSHDPHGDAIPDAAGNVTRSGFVLLGQAQPGHSGTVLRISDRNAEVLRECDSHSIRPGVTITVDADGFVVGSNIVTLSDEALNAIWVSA